MTVVVTDCKVESLASVRDENKRLREQLKKASKEIESMEATLHRFRQDMTTLLQELTGIRTLEMQIERTLTSLLKKRAHFEEALIKASHSFDKLMR